MRLLGALWIFAAVGAAQSQNIQFPAWFHGAPEAKGAPAVISATSVSIEYRSPKSTAEISAFYEAELKKADVEFRAGFDGVGVSVRAIQGKMLCVARISEMDSGSVVHQGCSVQGNELTFNIPEQRPRPAPLGIVTHKVEYSIAGAGYASITMTNESGATEQHRVSVPFYHTFDVGRGFFAYISAQEGGAGEHLMVTLRVDGEAIQQAESTTRYGIATASGKVE